MDALTLDGRSVILAHEDRFIARYVERSLREAGADVLGPAFSPDELAFLLDGALVSACVISAAHAPAACAFLTHRGGVQPAFILMGRGGLAAGFPVSALPYPFAAYQVTDALCCLLR